MIADEIECMKCKGIMEKGKIMTPRLLKWVKGKPLTKLSALKGENVWTYRCKNCGFLEFYSY